MSLYFAVFMLYSTKMKRKSPQNRVKELRYVPSESLVANPKNWRIHPESQKTVFSGILDKIGIADALLVRELGDDRYMIIDGHLRAELLPNRKIPVLVLDVTEEEADEILLMHDSVTGMAECSTPCESDRDLAGLSRCRDRRPVFGCGRQNPKTGRIQTLDRRIASVDRASLQKLPFLAVSRDCEARVL